MFNCQRDQTACIKSSFSEMSMFYRKCKLFKILGLVVCQSIYILCVLYKITSRKYFNEFISTNNRRYYLQYYTVAEII